MNIILHTCNVSKKKCLKHGYNINIKYVQIKDGNCYFFFILDKIKTYCLKN